MAYLGNQQGARENNCHDLIREHSKWRGVEREIPRID